MKKSRQTTWRCFHCDEIFRSTIKAALHFGTYQNATPACQIDAAALRKMEADLAKYREEDSDLHRQIRHLESDHQTARRRAEEVGYDRGLRDGRALNQAA